MLQVSRRRGGGGSWRLRAAAALTWLALAGAARYALAPARAGAADPSLALAAPEAALLAGGAAPSPAPSSAQLQPLPPPPPPPPPPLRGALPPGSASTCPYAEWRAQGSFDPLRRHVALTAEQQALAEARNPFLCSGGGAKYSKVIQIRLPYFNDRQDKKQRGSGFGGNLNVIAELVRYAATKGLGVRFPRFAQWIYGDPENGTMSWDLFFHEITAPECVAAGAQDWVLESPRSYANATLRHSLKLQERFEQGPLAASRNAEILRQAGLAEVVPADNDVQAMRLLFRWAFRLQPATRARVAAAQAPALAAIAGRPYIAVHVRWGDKVGRGDLGKDGQESELFPLSSYAQAVACFYGAAAADGADEPQPPRLVFVATDDFAAVTELRALLGAGFEVLTLATESERGHVESDFMHQSGAQRLRDVERLYAELEILARAELFVGNQKSNVWRVVHHMRFDKAPHSSLTVHTFQGSGRPTCCVGPVPERMKWVSTSGWCSGDCTA
jgi:hypothetical protein